MASASRSAASARSRSSLVGVHDRIRSVPARVDSTTPIQVDVVGERRADVLDNHRPHHPLPSSHGLGTTLSTWLVSGLIGTQGRRSGRPSPAGESVDLGHPRQARRCDEHARTGWVGFHHRRSPRTLDVGAHPRCGKTPTSVGQPSAFLARVWQISNDFASMPVGDLPPVGDVPSMTRSTA